MKMNLSKLILMLASLGGVTSVAQAETQLFLGGWSGNGGDLHAAASNSWFAGSEPIEACVETKNFPVMKQAEAETLVREAVADWQAFFQEYGLTDDTFNKASRFGSMAFPDGKSRGMTMQFTWKSCDKIDRQEEAVRFMFGAANEAVSFFREMATENAYGLALRRSYDHKTYRSGGIVWVSGELKTREEIKHLLLHELGHVFGMQHDSVFVMDEDVVRHLTDRREGVAAFLGSIESPAWRYALQNDGAVVMTSHGRRPPLDARRPTLCRDQQYRPNRILPPFVIHQLALDPLDCHRIEFKMLAPLPHGGRQAQLTMKELRTRREWSWEGEFSPQPDTGHHNLGPGIFTQWRVAGPAGTSVRDVWRRVDLDEQSPSFPAQGYLAIGTERHALQVSLYKGLRLQIFFPEVGMYWILRTVHDADLNTEMAF